MKSALLLFTIVTTLFISGCQRSTEIIDGPRLTGKMTISFARVPASITQVVATLSRPGAVNMVLSLTIADSGQSASGTFQDIGAGVWHLKVEALDDTGTVRFVGETDVEIVPGQTVRADLVLQPAGGGLEIRITWGGDNGDISSGLALYMKFDGNIADSSGQGNNGSSEFQNFTSDPWGNPGSAYLFNGTNNFISVPDSPALNPSNQLTIAMWIRIDSVTNNYPLILSKGAPQTDGFSNREYLVTWKANYDHPYFQIYSAGDGSYQHELIQEAPAESIGEWVYFTAVIDRQAHHMQLFINGTLTQQVDDDYSSFNSSSHPLLIGWTEEVAGDYGKFLGAMDNLRIYTRALTPGQIQTLYNSHK